MNNTLVICIAVAVCWLSTMAVAAYYIYKGRGVSVRKTVEVAV